MITSQSHQVSHSAAAKGLPFGKGSGDRVVLLSEVAYLTGLSTKTLKRIAAQEDGLKLFKLSPRRLAVMQSELQRWLSTRMEQAA